MSKGSRSRYRQVSRRAMLRGSLGVGTVAMFPGLACGTGDEQVFAGAVADPTTTTTAPPTTATSAATATTDPGVDGESVPTTAVEQAEDGSVAVDGEMVISFTYTQAAGGKNEPPYVAVWLENAVGDLVTTVSLWYEQGRRGERWLDHLTRWYDRELASGTTTISSATRAAGSYAVVWDGNTETGPAAAGDYFVCIESAREEGSYSLVRAPLTLGGSLAETALPDDGELSAASVRIDA